MAEAVAEEYRSSLCDLNFNSKPHINMLTMLAEENVKHAPLIVDTIVSHIKTVPSDLKLPSLYLVDSIMKNIGGQYITLFSKHMITLFSSVFEKVEEGTRSALYKLRQTWNDVLPKNILYGIDCNVNHIDPAWPITAKVPTAVSTAPAKNPIHVNPKFLGGSPTQGPPAARNQGKSTVVKKNEAVSKEKEVFEIKKKQEEMLRLIEEKKVQLKALEQKKLEMAAKQKKKSISEAPVLSQQAVQKKPVNHRDPRLKKNIAISQTGADLKGIDKPSAVTLQSVVVVPSAKLSSDAIANSNGDRTTKSILKITDEKQNVANKSFHTNEQIANSQKNISKHIDEKTTKEIHKDKDSPNKEHLSRNCKVNKKHSISPENKLGSNAKKFCKHPVGKLKRPLSQDDDSHPSKDQIHVRKKEKQELTKSKNKPTGGTCSSPDGRLREALLFGTEDKDYRHQLRTDDEKPKERHHPESAQLSNARAPNEEFNPIDHNSVDLPSSTAKVKYYHDSTTVQRPVLNQPHQEMYQAVPVDPMKPDKFQQIEHAGKMKDVRENQTRTFSLKENQDANYVSKPIHVARDRFPPLSTTSFMLDNKNRTIYFVNDRALTVLDNNEPREVTFAGPPRNVHVEGLPHPLVLGFDGRRCEFDTEGKRNIVHFGTPSREIYINNFPYEAQFGGPSFTALLEDKKEHRVRIDGPPPQVVLSEKPAYELFEILNVNKASSQQSIAMDQNISNKGPEGAALLQDVDMRVKPSIGMKSSILPEIQKDIDWRHVSSSDSTPWNVPKNSIETYKDVPGTRNYTINSCSMAPNSSTQLDYNNSSVGIQRERFVPERHNDANHVTWPHPAYREVLPSMERPAFDQSHQNSQHIPPNAWELQTPHALPPPPSIPPSLNLPTPSNYPTLPAHSLPNLQSLSQLPNLSVPPPSWNHPLPPPPMFSGSVGETLNLSTLSVPAVSSTTVPESISSLSASLPVNVTAIYEKLVAAGIISKTTEEPLSSVSEVTNKDENSSDEMKNIIEDLEIPEIRLTSKSLRQFNPAVITVLYRGAQCATCGMRFKEIQSEQYSRHLDWHFRMNRREKDGAKKAYSRRLYYEVKDWIQFKEIEEAEERTPSYFELQADGDASRNEEKEKIQSVPASECETEKCSVCGEQFQLFWVEEEEEWHLKHAVRHDGEAYHPMCYEDFKKAEELANKEPEVPEETPSDSVKEDSEEKMSVEETTASEEIKEEKDNIVCKEELDPVSSEPIPESVKVEKSDTESTAEDTVKPLDENTVSIKEEIVDELSATKHIEEGTESNQVLDTEMEVDKVDTNISSVVPVAEESNPVVKKSETPIVPQDKNSDSDSENVEEFRPPTPDPRFEVLPPVFKGTELSALCTIM